MVITEEIIAAYIEGKVSKSERKEIGIFLSKHPEYQDLVLALMDDSIDDEEIPLKTSSKTKSRTVGKHLNNLFASAAFVPNKIEIPPNNEKEDLIEKRRKKMLSFWNELS